MNITFIKVCCKLKLSKVQVFNYCNVCIDSNNMVLVGIEYRYMHIDS